MRAFNWDWETVVCRTPYKALTLFLEVLRLEEQKVPYIAPEQRQEIVIGSGMDDLTEELLSDEAREKRYDVGIEIKHWRG